MTEFAHWSVRRASIEDLPQLKLHWESTGVDNEALEKKLTEFQIAEDAEGTIRGVIGVRLAEQEAWIYHESFSYEDQGDPIREAIWLRIKNLAQNHALFKIWTHSTAPSWNNLGFVDATPDILSGKPSVFENETNRWKVLVLREPEQGISLDKEFELFQQEQLADRENLMNQAALMKKLSYVLLVIVVIGGVTLLVISFMKGMTFLGR